MSGEGIEILVFALDGRRYGLLASVVREVLRAASLTPLPRRRGWSRGVLDLRGEIVPVLDIRQRLGHPPKALGAEDHLLVALRRGRPVGLRIDRALDLVAVAAAQIADAADLTQPAELVAGIARLPDGLVLINDLDRFLSRAEEDRLADALAELAP